MRNGHVRHGLRRHVVRRIGWSVVLVCLALDPVGASCSDADGDGFFYEPGCGTLRDCNDADDKTYPGALERCDGFDRDCDGLVDNAPLCDPSCPAPGVVRNDSSHIGGHTTRLVWTGTGYGATWHLDNQDVQFVLLDATGRVTAGPTRVASRAGGGHDLVWNGSGFGLVWGHADRDLYFRRIDGSGQPVGQELRVTSDRNGYIRPSLVWNGSGYGVSADQNDTLVFLLRLDARGLRFPGLLYVYDEWGRHTSLTWNGDGYGLAWGSLNRTEDIRFQRVDARGMALGDPVVVASAGDRPKVVWTGSEYGIVWTDSTSGRQLRFNRLDAFGNKKSADVEPAPGALWSGQQSLVWTGSRYGIQRISRRTTGGSSGHLLLLDDRGNLASDLVVVPPRAGLWNYRDALAWSGRGFTMVWTAGPTESIVTRVTCDAVDGGR